MKKFLVVIGIVCSIVSLFAQRWYETKSFEEWSVKEAERMLAKSPWVDSQIQASASGGGVTRAAQMSGGVPRGGGSAEQGDTRTILRGYWYSARPARMAIANTALRNNPELDRQQLQEFATAAMPDAVLALTVESSPGSRMAAMNALQQWTLEDVQAVTTLSTKSGKKLPPSGYRPPEGDGTGAKFIFPRTLADGRPLLEASDGEARFETRFKLGRDSVRIRFKYKLKNMVIGDQLEY